MLKQKPEYIEKLAKFGLGDIKGKVSILSDPKEIGKLNHSDIALNGFKIERQSQFDSIYH